LAAPATPAARSSRTRARAAASPASRRAQARRRAAAAAARRGHASRSTAVPSRSRRISGPAKRRRATTSTKARFAFVARVAALADARLVDRVLRGRAWIGVVGVLLIGLVALQVSMLKLNAGIGASVERSSTLERQNSRLEASIARLSSADRIRAKARTLGLVPPRVDRNRYVWARPANAKLAAAAIAGGAFAPPAPAGTDPAAAATDPSGDPTTTTDTTDTTDTTGGAYTPDQIDSMLNDGDPSNDAQAMLNDGDPSNDADAMLSDGDPSNDDQALAGDDGSGDGSGDGTG
jgi:hypothetical protein